MAQSNRIDRTELNSLVFQGGIPDEIKGLRPLIWRVLLNYLPEKNTECWPEMLRDQKAAYDVWKTEFVVVPEVKQEEGATKKRIVDNPLSMQADSKWK